MLLKTVVISLFIRRNFNQVIVRIPEIDGMHLPLRALAGNWFAFNLDVVALEVAVDVCQVIAGNDAQVSTANGRVRGFAGIPVSLLQANKLVAAPQRGYFCITLLLDDWHVEDFVVKPGRLRYVAYRQDNVINTTNLHGKSFLWLMIISWGEELLVRNAVGVSGFVNDFDKSTLDKPRVYRRFLHWEVKLVRVNPHAVVAILPGAVNQ